MRKISFCMAMFLFSVRAGTEESLLSVNLPAQRTAMGYCGFSDVTTYNSLDFCGSPMGLFEKENATAKIDLKMRRTTFELENYPDSLYYRSRCFACPNLLIGAPGLFYANLYYQPNPVDVRAFGDELVSEYSSPLIDSITRAPLEQASLMLHRFGFTIAGGHKNGLFRLGLDAQGFYGKQHLDGSENERVIMGFRNLGLYLNTQIHELIRIGFKGSASGYLDTLVDTDTRKDYLGYVDPHEDRYFSGVIPCIGGDIDFGREGFPVHSNFNLDISKIRYIYVTKFLGYSISGSEGGNEDALAGDSLSLSWQTLVDLEVKENRFHPAVRFDYRRNGIVQCAPTDDNNNPLQYERMREDTSWEYKSVSLGIGGAAFAGKYGRANFEYTYNYLSLSYGDAWPDSSDRSGKYSRIAAGIEGNVHAIRALNMPESIRMYLRLGFLYVRENARFNAYGAEEFYLVNGRTGPLSQYARYLQYDPRFGWGPQQKIYRFSAGIGTDFRDGLLQGNFILAFPVKKVENLEFKGFELGLDLAYSLKRS